MQADFGGIGRPWRNYAKTVFLDCSIGKHIHPALFHDWNKPDARTTVVYGVGYRNMQDKNVRELFPQCADFVQELQREQIDGCSKERVLSAPDNWAP